MSDSNQPHPENSGSDPSNRKKTRSTRKFYVRSGEVNWIVLAKDADTAALLFVQNALNGSLISGRKAVNKQLQLLDQQAMELLAAPLDPRIFISESGFTNSEAGQFVTSLVIKRWRTQIAALEKLIRPKN